MSPQQTIEIHFAQIMGLSQELQNLASSIRGLGERELMQISRAGRDCWSSECAQILAGKEVKVASRLCAEAEALAKTAAEMERRAKKMYQSEMMNIHLAAERIYR